MLSFAESLSKILSSFAPSSLETRLNGYWSLALLFVKSPGNLAPSVRPLVEDAFRSAIQSNTLAAVTFLTALF